MVLRKQHRIKKDSSRKKKKPNTCHLSSKDIKSFERSKREFLYETQEQILTSIPNLWALLANHGRPWQISVIILQISNTLKPRTRIVWFCHQKPSLLSQSLRISKRTRQTLKMLCVSNANNKTLLILFKYMLGEPKLCFDPVFIFGLETPQPKSRNQIIQLKTYPAWVSKS